MGKKETEVPTLELLSGQRHARESDKAVQACNDFLRLGVGRTVPMLHDEYEFTLENLSPTKSLPTLYQWHKEFEWKARAAIYDVDLEQRKNAEREAVIKSGLALEYERVKKLTRLARLLESQIYEQSGDGTFPNLWVRDVKSVGYKDDAEIVDIERFNPALLEQYRKTLEDIAKEVGGRIVRTDLTTGGDKLELPRVFLPKRVLDADDD